MMKLIRGTEDNSSVKCFKRKEDSPPFFLVGVKFKFCVAERIFNVSIMIITFRLCM